MEELQLREVSSKLEDLKKVIASFAQLLTKENKALREFDVEAVSALYEQKIKIVSAYRSMSAFFIKSQENLSALSDEQKKSLKTVSQELDALLKENDLLLKTRMETSESVIGSIVNAAKASTKKSATSYGAHGQFAKVDNHHSSMAINSTF